MIAIESAATPEHIYDAVGAFLAQKDPESDRLREYVLDETELKETNNIFQYYGVQAADSVSLLWTQVPTQRTRQGYILPPRRQVDIIADSGPLYVMYDFEIDCSGQFTSNRAFMIDENIKALQAYGVLPGIEEVARDIPAPVLESLTGMRLIERNEYFALSSLTRYLQKKG